MEESDNETCLFQRRLKASSAVTFVVASVGLFQYYRTSICFGSTVSVSVVLSWVTCVCCCRGASASFSALLCHEAFSQLLQNDLSPFYIMQESEGDQEDKKEVICKFLEFLFPLIPLYSFYHQCGKMQSWWVTPRHFYYSKCSLQKLCCHQLHTMWPLGVSSS